MTTELLIREGAIESMTATDVSEMAARYLLMVVPESSSVNYPEIEDFRPADASDGLEAVVSELLSAVVKTTLDRGISSEMIVQTVVRFKVNVVTATLAEAPAQSLVSVANLFENVVHVIGSTRP